MIEISPESSPCVQYLGPGLCEYSITLKSIVFFVSIYNNFLWLFVSIRLRTTIQAAGE